MAGDSFIGQNQRRGGRKRAGGAGFALDVQVACRPKLRRRTNSIPPQDPYSQTGRQRWNPGSRINFGKPPVGAFQCSTPGSASPSHRYQSGRNQGPRPHLPSRPSSLSPHCGPAVLRTGVASLAGWLQKSDLDAAQRLDTIDCPPTSRKAVHARLTRINSAQVLFLSPLPAALPRASRGSRREGRVSTLSAGGTITDRTGHARHRSPFAHPRPHHHHQCH